MVVLLLGGQQDRLSPHSAWTSYQCVVHQGSLLASFCFSSSLLMSEYTPPHYCCWVWLFSANCVLYLFYPPNIPLVFTLNDFTLYFCLWVSSFFHLILHVCLNAPLTASLSFQPGLLLCCGDLQKHSGQMVSEDFRALLISTGNSLVLQLALSMESVCRSR